MIYLFVYRNDIRLNRSVLCIRVCLNTATNEDCTGCIFNRNQENPAAATDLEKAQELYTGRLFMEGQRSGRTPTSDGTVEKHLCGTPENLNSSPDKCREQILNTGEVVFEIHIGSISRKDFVLPNKLFHTPRTCSYADEHTTNDTNFLLIVFSNVGQGHQKHGWPSRNTIKSTRTNRCESRAQKWTRGRASLLNRNSQFLGKWSTPVIKVIRQRASSSWRSTDRLSQCVWNKIGLVENRELTLVGTRVKRKEQDMKCHETKFFMLKIIQKNKWKLTQYLLFIQNAKIIATVCCLTPLSAAANLDLDNVFLRNESMNAVRHSLWHSIKLVNTSLRPVETSLSALCPPRQTLIRLKAGNVLFKRFHMFCDWQEGQSRYGRFEPRQIVLSQDRMTIARAADRNSVPLRRREIDAEHADLCLKVSKPIARSDKLTRRQKQLRFAAHSRASRQLRHSCFWPTVEQNISARARFDSAESIVCLHSVT